MCPDWGLPVRSTCVCVGGGVWCPCVLTGLSYCFSTAVSREFPAKECRAHRWRHSLAEGHLERSPTPWSGQSAPPVPMAVHPLSRWGGREGGREANVHICAYKKRSLQCIKLSCNRIQNWCLLFNWLMYTRTYTHTYTPFVLHIQVSVHW